MPSEEDFRALQEQVQSLAAQLNVARNRIDELEDFATDHIGLDWGESLVDANSPHPNMSVNTLESGGGIIRQDAIGMQLAPTSNADTPAITWHRRFISKWTEITPPYAYVGSEQDTTSSLLKLTSIGSSVAYSQITEYADDAGSQISLLAQRNTYGNGTIDVASGSAGPFVRLQGRIAVGYTVTPSQITASQNDYSPTDLSTASALRLSTDASRDITGMTGAFAGRLLLLLNVGGFDIVLKDENASSSAANRFALAADITLAPDNSALLWYDGTSSRWRCLARYT